MVTGIPCAIVFSDRHELAFVDALLSQYPLIGGYIVGQDGRVVTRRGSPATHLRELPFAHVVWVGVPSRWALTKVGSPNLFRSHFVGSDTRFSAIKNSVMISRTVEAALDAIEAAKAKVVATRVQATEEAVVEARARRLGEPAAWYIPDCLR